MRLYSCDGITQMPTIKMLDRDCERMRCCIVVLVAAHDSKAPCMSK